MICGAGGAMIVGGLPETAEAQRALCSPSDHPPFTPSPTFPEASKFTDPFFIPPVASPVPLSSLNPPPNLTDESVHQLITQYPPQLFYQLVEQEVMHDFTPVSHVYSPSPVWVFNQVNPIVQARYGQPILVRYLNNLPCQTLAPPPPRGNGDPYQFGDSGTATHLHNFHSHTNSDGVPWLKYYPMGCNPGAPNFQDSHYAMFPAGQDPKEVMNYLWYHDHAEDHTAENVYKGLAGPFFAFDELDSGDENDPNPNAFHLPSGQFDVPFVWGDKRFDANGFLTYDRLQTDGFLGDIFTVNGIAFPVFHVAARKYRFRLLNAGPSRFYDFFLVLPDPSDPNNPDKETVISKTQITNDGNFLAHPITVDHIPLSVSERADIVVDFSQFAPGTVLYAENRLQQTNGRGPSGHDLTDASQFTRIVKFVVGNPVPDNSQVPQNLRPDIDVNLGRVVNTRLWQMDYLNGLWTINGRIFNRDRADAVVKLNTAEKWVFRNEGGIWSHPMHTHLEEQHLLSRNGVRPVEVGGTTIDGRDQNVRKDTFRLGPNDEIVMFIQFRDFTGSWVMHCHNVVHEDNAMMIRFDVVP